MKQRLMLSEIVNVAAFFCGLATRWQVVRFFQGEVGVPEPFGTLEASLSMMFATSGKLPTIWHYIFGAAAWTSLSALVFDGGGVLRRLIADGWARFLADEKATDQESVRMYRLEESRERRRVARANFNRRAGSGLVPFAVGAAFAAWILLL